MIYFNRNINHRWVQIKIGNDELKSVINKSLNYAAKLQNKIKSREDCKELSETERQNIFLKNCPNLNDFLQDYVSATAEKMEEQES